MSGSNLDTNSYLVCRTTRPRQQYDELPKPPIAAVLHELGAENVPTGYGWCRMSCPFHEDRTPSASVNHDEETGGFNCHSCGLKGDGIKLLQAVLHLTFAEAVERAHALTGTTTTRGRPARKRRASDLLKGMQ